MKTKVLFVGVVVVVMLINYLAHPTAFATTKGVVTQAISTILVVGLVYFLYSKFIKR